VAIREAPRLAPPVDRDHVIPAIRRTLPLGIAPALR
jgi:hypothetical protein